MDDGSHAERPDGFGEGVSGEGYPPEVGVIVERLVDTEVQILPGREPALVERRKVPPRGI